MTKKDYIAIAAILRDANLRLGFCVGAEDAINQITNDLTALFARDNPRFDRKRFFAACR